MITPEIIYHTSELAVLAGIAWRVIKAANRIAEVLRDFPPHRHVNGSIIFPDGYEPTRVERFKI